MLVYMSWEKNKKTGCIFVQILNYEDVERMKEKVVGALEQTRPDPWERLGL